MNEVFILEKKIFSFITFHYLSPYAKKPKNDGEGRKHTRTHTHMHSKVNICVGSPCKLKSHSSVVSQ